MRLTTDFRLTTILSLALLLPGCGDDGGDGMTDGSDGMTDGGDTGSDRAEPKDPATAERALIDRFSETAGTLMVRTDENGLPGPGEPIDYDQGAPFITRGLGPGGEVVQYYNFDVQRREMAPIFALFREGEDIPVEGQLNVVDVIPGDDGYSDFWHVHKVTVPADYVANTLTNVSDVMESGYPIERTSLVVNCPIVPEGSTADLRLEEGSSDLVMGWYDDQVVFYFDFSEKMLMVDPPAEGHPMTPVSPIYVAFNVNPDPADPASGPASGFMTEDGSDQTHNVLATLPEDAAYSPLWTVNVYDNAEFDAVMDLVSATSANILDMGVADVNCPVVEIQ